jgi:hypothetical protein
LYSAFAGSQADGVSMFPLQCRILAFLAYFILHRHITNCKKKFKLLLNFIFIVVCLFLFRILVFYCRVRVIDGGGIDVAGDVRRGDHPGALRHPSPEGNFWDSLPVGFFINILNF